MSKRTKQPTYREWLRDQRQRDDPVGDLARDWFADRPDHPRGPTMLEHLAYLRERGACEGALAACQRAWGEYWSRFPPTGRPCHHGPRRRGRRRGRWSPRGGN